MRTTSCQTLTRSPEDQEPTEETEEEATEEAEDEMTKKPEMLPLETTKRLKPLEEMTPLLLPKRDRPGLAEELEEEVPEEEEVLTNLC